MSVETGESRHEVTGDRLRQQAFEQDVTRRAEHAFLGRQAVDVLVAAAVSPDESAVGRVAAGLFDRIQETTGPDGNSPDDELRVIEMAATLAHEVHDQAHDETVNLLRTRIAELELFLGPNNLRMKAELESLRRENAGLRAATMDQVRVIKDLKDDKETRDLLLFQMERRLDEQAAPAETVGTEAVETPARRRSPLGIKAVAQLFRPSAAM